MGMLKSLMGSFIFWGAWIIIPVVAEILPSLGSIFVLIRRRIQFRKGYDRPAIFPDITIIVPVYNSADTLTSCLRSICDSTYPTEAIQVYLVNNGSQDDSFRVYTRCQSEFPNLNMQWLNSDQGKSRALNLALYNSTGKYIINIDSDGLLEPHALENMVVKFEALPDVNCMTGTILTMVDKIAEYNSGFSRLLRHLEFMEYSQAFLAGRSYAAELNAVYTLSGAFSAFRKSAILSSRLYNTETLCEDTHLTFQIRYLQGQRVEICENAIFYTEPIEDIDKLYTQRQRWQRGSLEVAEMFGNKRLSPFRIFSDVNVRALIFDHTFAFPRLIWYVALLCMICINYSSRAVFISTGIIFALYILTRYLYYISVLLFLKMLPEIRKYYLSHWWVTALLPLFNLMVFFIRIAGIINSIDTDSSWRAKTLTQEKEEFLDQVKTEGNKVFRVLGKIRSAFERPASKEENSTGISWLWYVGCGLLLLLSAALIFSVHWVAKTYGVSFEVLIKTLTGNLQGTSKDVIFAVILGCVAPPLAVVAGYVLVLLLLRLVRRKKPAGAKKNRRGLARALPVLGAVLLFSAVLYANGQFDVLAYYVEQNTVTPAAGASDVYEEYYVAPGDAVITPGEKTKNLIYIYLESMETTYASQEAGGVQETNYMPNLTALARENVSFSDSQELGGFHTVTGAGYTMAALFSTTSGVPYRLPVDTTVIADSDSFASGITTLGDLLHDYGYRQMFLCGSDAAFGGRKLYFTQHGGYEIFDLFTARDEGYIPPDYHVWWGYEDYRLFDIAKDQVQKLASSGQPFNLTMLTVDTHHIGGYHCPMCGSEYSVDTANVVSCTDRLVAQFVEWCKEQPFYEDTVIVITGDHPRMDNYLVEHTTFYDRTVYNCILNSAVQPENTKEREFTHMDIFPTVLSAMGYEIEGEKLGLGTNLFSGERTLAETLGFYLLDSKVAKNSTYYLSTFAPELSN